MKKEELLQKLFHGQCSKEELAILFDLIEKDSAAVGPEVMAELAKQMDQEVPISSSKSAEIFDKLSLGIEDKTKSDNNVISIRQNNSRQTVVWLSGIAASILLLVSIFWYSGNMNQPELLSIETAAGEIRKIMLPDSSQVTLNGKTKLSFAENWEQGEIRTIHLEGEAYFDVSHKISSQTKFQVITPELKVEVLGTHFNVKSRKAETSVFLDEGKVKVNLYQKENEEILMKPGELLTYSTSNANVPSTRSVASELHTSWKTGVMVFKDAPLQEILDVLVTVYDLELVIQDTSLALREFTFGLPTEELQISLTVLERMIGEKIIRKDNKLFIGTK